MATEFQVRVRGISFQNEDGSDRQKLAALCKAGDTLSLRAEPDNPHDRHAVAVLNASGQQLGWLPSDAQHSSALLRGELIQATVAQVIDGGRWWHRLFRIKRSRGVLIELTKGAVD